MTLTGQQLQDIGAEMFGQKWRPQIADALGISTARISQLANAATISPKSAAKIISLHDHWKQTGKVEPGIVQIGSVQRDPDANLSDKEIVERVRKRFGVMGRIVDGMLKNVIRSLIVSGAPGIGKSYDLEQKVKKAHREQGLDYTIMRGTCSPSGLYQALYQAKDGGIVVIDDCDSVFDNEEAFNILKSALDSTNVRTIAWRKQSKWIYDVRNKDDIGPDDERFPNEFDFEGAVVFITNLNFRAEAENGKKKSPHFGALLSRSMYLDLTLHSQRAKVLWIKDVFHASMRRNLGLNEQEGNEILSYVLGNADRLSELSLRMVKHISDMYRLGDDWQDIVEYTKMKTPKID